MAPPCETTRLLSCPSALTGAHATGEPVRVVAVGGSVTTGMGAPRPQDAYLALVVAWLRSLGDAAHPVRVEVGAPRPRRLSGMGPPDAAEVCLGVLRNEPLGDKRPRAAQGRPDLVRCSSGTGITYA
jgi:hypothetical protein